MNSKYLGAFEDAKAQCSGLYNLTGDVLIVEKVQGQELKKDVMRHDGTKVQLHLAGGTEKKIDGLDMNLPMFARVLAVGPGFYDPTDSDAAPIGCEVEPGDIILIGRMSVNWFSVFGSLVSTSTNELGLTRESEVRMRFKGQAGYDKFFEALNQQLAPKVTDAAQSKDVQPAKEDSCPTA